MATTICSENYNRIRSDIVQECTLCSEQDILRLKQIFAARVNSVRRLDQILNINDLIIILEKRDVLNLQNLNCFQEIVNALKISKFNNNFTSSPTSPPGVIPPAVSQETRDEIYDLISKELGIRWRDFARALKFNNAKIEELEDRYKLLSERIRQVLLHHEHSSDSITWTPIYEALRKSRRNDLRIKIERIIH